MTKLYSVYHAQRTTSESAARAIPERFSWYAFVLTPVWALHRGGWRTFLVWLAALIVLGILAALLGARGGWAYWLIGLYFGFAAPEFEADEMRRKGFRESGFLLAGSDLEAQVVALSGDSAE
ncbi:MAG: DUF2628 domain-containing protein [Hyphomicrobiaceae bacterium]|nr:DUF2628 domain-containing protein [Hyphomicrobiaceae bacterium]